MMECKHVMANFTMRDEPNVIRGCYAVWLGPINESAKKYRADFGYSPGRVLSAKCDSCGAQLGLGPSNDTAVDEDIRAAEISISVERDPEMHDYKPADWRGWDAHKDPEWTVLDGEHAGWLARELSTHDDRDTRDADAWPWDPSRPIAEQWTNVPLPESEIPPAFRTASADSEPRQPGCRCHLEVGDSPCPVHPSADDDPSTVTISNVTLTLDPPGPDLPELTPAESAELVRILSDVPSEACVCGHAKEDHGGHVDYPGSSARNECEPDACIAYEVDA